MIIIKISIRIFCKIVFSKAVCRRSYKINVFLKNFAQFIEKYLCWSLLFNKVAGWKETLVQVFLCGFWEMFKNNYLVQHVQNALSVILGNPYVGISSTRSTGWKYTWLFSPLNRYTLVQLISTIINWNRNNTIAN